MECHFFLRALLTLSGTVWTSVDAKETNQEFSCCDLPMKIQLNRSNIEEFSLGRKSVAIATPSIFQADAPFAVHGDTALTVGKCVDFHRKTVFENQNGSRDENRFHYHGLPCNGTAPGHPLQGPALAGFILMILLAVGGVIGGVIGAICFFKRRQPRNDNGVV